MPIAFQNNSTSQDDWLNKIYMELIKRSQVLATEYDRRGHFEDIKDANGVVVNDSTTGKPQQKWVYDETPQQWMDRIRYPDARTADFNEDIKNAHILGKKTGIPRDHFDASRRGIGEAHVSFPEAYEEYIKPYTQYVIDDLTRDTQDHFNKEVLPSIANQFVSLGQHGSSRQKDAVLQATENMQKTLLSKTNAAKQAGLESASRMFNADKERRLHAAQAEGELGRMEQASYLTDIDTLMRQGIQAQSKSQAEVDLKVQDWMMQQNMPRSLWTQHAALVHGMPYQGESITASYQPNPQTQAHLNWQGNLGNIAGQMYGAHMQRRSRGGLIRKRKSRIGPHLMNIRRKK